MRIAEIGIGLVLGGFAMAWILVKNFNKKG